MQGAADVEEVFWIAAMRPGAAGAADINYCIDFFILSINDPLSNAGWWISEWDVEVQYSIWNDKSRTFAWQIEDLRWTDSDIRGLLGGVMLDWHDETRDVCLSALCNFPID